MKLSSPIYRLSLRFDVDRLQHEIAQLPDEAWATHPNGYSGNSSLVLVSVGGTMNDDFAIAGSMQPTRWLLQCPYLMQVLTSLQSPISRTRLMRLDGRSTVPKHRDANYHWFRRTRVHVPIVTHESVEFVCDNETTHFAAGEAWTFDNSRPHEVRNPAEQSRIHLVIDTRGSESFWKMAAATNEVAIREAGINEAAIPVPPERRFVPFDPNDAVQLSIEPYRFEVLTTSEMTELAGHIESHVAADLEVAHEVRRLSDEWGAAFERFGHSTDGEMAYAGCISQFRRRLSGVALGGDAEFAFDVISSMLRTTNRTVKFSGDQTSTTTVKPQVAQPVLPVGEDVFCRQTRYVRNQNPGSSIPPLPALQRALEMFASPASTGEALNRIAADERPPMADFAATVGSLLKLRLLNPVANFDRPVFIVSAPRSGSTLLFETLSQAHNVWTIGDESHRVIESIPSLHPKNHQWASNRLTSEDATARVIARLQTQFTKLLRDRSGSIPDSSVESQSQPTRLLAKTPKDSLRIPFLKAVFPDARFIFLYRDPAPNISSIMEGWRSRRFITYSKLPDWESMPWSFLLPPGWRDCQRSTLAEIAAFQWKAANEHILKDLSSLPADDWCLLRYDELIQHPQHAINRLCQFADWAVDEQLSGYLTRPLPLARYTLSEPSFNKWRKNEESVRSILPTVQTIVEQVNNCVTSDFSTQTPQTQVQAENGVAA